MRKYLKPSLNWLLVFLPLAVWAEYTHPESHRVIFLAACLAIVPLAAVLGHATEDLAARSGEGLGGFLNATFGNAAELIIGIVAIKAGKIEIVKRSVGPRKDWYRVVAGPFRNGEEARSALDTLERKASP